MIEITDKDLEIINQKMGRIYRQACLKCGSVAVYKTNGYCWTCWNIELGDFQRFFIERRAQKEKKMEAI